MDASDILGSYHAFCQMAFVIRRYDRAADPPYVDYPVTGHYRLYDATELAGGIVQGDMRAIIIADDLIARDFPMPLLKQDKVVLDGRERAIINLAERKALDGTLIAYELQVRG